MAAGDILAALQGQYETAGDQTSGLGAQAIATALPSLVNPYGSTGGNIASVFGGSILAALLGKMAKSDAAEANVGIANNQSDFLKADPATRLTMTQADPEKFSKLQAALNANDLVQQAADTATRRQLEIKNEVANKSADLPGLLNAFGVPVEKQAAFKTVDQLDAYLAHNPDEFKQRQESLQLERDAKNERAQATLAERKDRVDNLQATRLTTQLLKTNGPYAIAQQVAPLG